MMNVKRRLEASLDNQPEAVLTLALLAIAAGLVALALWPGHPIVKVAVLAWVILP